MGIILPELVLPKKFQRYEISKRFTSHTYFMFTIFAMVMYLYDQMYDLDFNIYNVTSHNMVYLVLKYLKSKQEHKLMYNKISKKLLDDFYTNNFEFLTLYEKINVLYNPLKKFEYYFIYNINLNSFKLINNKHYTNTLFNEPLYYEPCIFFAHHYNYMYALPFFGLASVVLIHNVMTNVVSKLKRASINLINKSPSSASSIMSSFPAENFIRKNKEQNQLNGNIFDDVIFDEYNVINGVFYQIKTKGNILNRLLNSNEFPLDIDILLFQSKIHMTSLVRVKEEPQVLEQIYIMTNVDISINLLIPIIYETLMQTKGIVMSELIPYELNECKMNTILKTQRVIRDEKTNLTIETLMETPHNDKNFENILFQCLIKEKTNSFLFDSKPNEDSIISKMFFHWIGLGYIPSIILSRFIFNVSHIKQNMEESITNGIFICGHMIYYLKLLNVQNYELISKKLDYLPKAFYITPTPITTQFKRITQTLFYASKLNTLLFSNYSILNNNIIDDAKNFFAINTKFNTTSLKVIRDIFEKSSVLKFMDQEKFATITYGDNVDISLTKLTFSCRIHFYIFTTNKKNQFEFSLIDLINKILLYNKIQPPNFKFNSIKELLFNILNIHELCR